MSDKHVDDVAGVETTGHEWDGIRELNNPLPRWWLWTFYACIIWAVGYTVVYPAWPMVSSATTGLLGYSSRGELDKEMDIARLSQGELRDRLASTPVADISGDANLARFAQAGGKSAFKVYCSQCHGTGANGGVGYPNLNDDEWIWGGSIDQIYQTITHGSRFAGDDDTHFNMMPNFGTEDMLTGEQITAVARQVASLSGMEDGLASDEGGQIFTDNCAGCHGAGGEGSIEAGAPSLSDPIWLYEGTLAAIRAQIAQPRHGVMPAWGERLGDATVKELAVYVHSLGGGQ